MGNIVFLSLGTVSTLNKSLEIYCGNCPQGEKHDIADNCEVGNSLETKGEKVC